MQFGRGLSAGVAAVPWLLGPGGVFLQLERKLVGCCVPVLERAVGSSSPLGFLRFWCSVALPSQLCHLSKFRLLLETLDVWLGCLLDAPEALQEGRESGAWRWQELREPLSLRHASWLQHQCFS